MGSMMLNEVIYCPFIPLSFPPYQHNFMRARKPGGFLSPNRAFSAVDLQEYEQLSIILQIPGLSYSNFFSCPGTNQYLKDSKLLSEQERRIAIDPLRIEDTNEMMVSLKAAVQDLRHHGVPIFDLTNIFSSTKDTVYKDDCCHLNNLGNQIMADAVVSKAILSQAGSARQFSPR
jgi:hypothetical protein